MPHQKTEQSELIKRTGCWSLPLLDNLGRPLGLPWKRLGFGYRVLEARGGDRNAWTNIGDPWRVSYVCEAFCTIGNYLRLGGEKPDLLTPV